MFPSRIPQILKLSDFTKKATLLASTALTNSTKENCGKAWGRFQQFCDPMGLNPIEVSGWDIVNWLVYRSKQTSSPNVLENNLKAIKFLGVQQLSLCLKYLW